MSWAQSSIVSSAAWQCYTIQQEPYVFYIHSPKMEPKKLLSFHSNVHQSHSSLLAAFSEYGPMTLLVQNLNQTNLWWYNGFSWISLVFSVPRFGSLPYLHNHWREQCFWKIISFIFPSIHSVSWFNLLYEFNFERCHMKFFFSKICLSCFLVKLSCLHKWIDFLNCALHELVEHQYFLQITSETHCSFNINGTILHQFIWIYFLFFRQMTYLVHCLKQNMYGIYCFSKRYILYFNCTLTIIISLSFECINDPWV